MFIIHYTIYDIQYLYSKLGTQHFFSFSTMTMRQCVRPRCLNGVATPKNIKTPVSKWISHNGYSHNAISDNFLVWKHVHIVATELSRAQLWQEVRERSNFSLKPCSFSIQNIHSYFNQMLKRYKGMRKRKTIVNAPFPKQI